MSETEDILDVFCGEIIEKTISIYRDYRIITETKDILDEFDEENSWQCYFDVRV